MQYKGQHKPIAQIARELNVDAVVEGTVLKSGSQVRITAQLIQAPLDRHLWAKSYEGDLHDILSLQDNVASAIAQEIQAAVTPQEQALLTSAHPVNPEAYEDYMQGRYFWNKRDDGALERAIEYFQRPRASIRIVLRPMLAWLKLMFSWPATLARKMSSWRRERSLQHRPCPSIPTFQKHTPL
jgi:hypothetical protein